MKVVLQKFIAEREFFSRRQAETLIREGGVKLNGKIAALGDRADDDDDVEIRGRRVQNLDVNKKKVSFILNKPIGYVCTTRMFKNEKNVFDLIDTRERLFIVGRLDKDSRGLVLLTNDGAMAQKMTHPKYECQKTYEVKISGPEKIDEAQIDFIERNFSMGVNIGDEDGVAIAYEVNYLGDGVFKVVLTQGKKRQLRRMFGALGYSVLDLKRTQLGEFKLGNLPEGQYKKV
ncbi:MAG: pseudouridine synthase [Candidatus Falkowbacteria bacterium]